MFLVEVREKTKENERKEEIENPNHEQNVFKVNERENLDSTKQNEEGDQSKQILSEFINYISEREVLLCAECRIKRTK